MRNALNLRFCFLVTFLLFIPLMYALPPEGITIKGRVTDETLKEGVPGANVTVKGTSIGAITDFDGNFTIVVPNRKSVLSISFIGYVTQEIVVGDRKFITVTLKEDSQNLGEVEVVAIAYGNQDRRMLTSAVSSIDNKELIKSPATSITNILAGALPGVSSVQTTGQPGKDAAAIYVRGVGSLNDSQSKPLILVDGVERAFSQIDPNEVETISVLKDASSTAVFGVRGANGVILITTRRGKSGKTQISASTKLGLQQPISLVEQTGSYEFARFWNMKQEMDHVTNPKLYFTPEQIEAYRTGSDPIMYPNMDWKKYIFHNLYLQSQNNVNISGGGSKVKYYMSLDVSHDSGLLNTGKAYSWNNNINIMNYTFQNNIAYKLTPTTTIKMNMNAQIRQKKSPNVSSEDLFKQILTTTPIEFPVTYPSQDGRIMYGNNIISGSTLYTNPYARMMTSFAETNENTLNTVIKIDQDLDFITKGLKINAFVNFKTWSSSYFDRSIAPYYYRIKSGSYDETDLENTNYELELLNSNGSDYISQSAIGKSSDQTFELQFNLNYARQFGLHNVGAMLLYKQREYRSDVLPNRNQGLSGRLTYDYGQRYLFEFNFGYNGTERLAKEDRFGFFPAVSLGWVISNEAFFEPMKNVVDNLKVRGSYGLVGSDDLATAGGSYYLYIDKITNNDLSYLKWTSGQNMDYQLGGPQMAYYAMSGLGWEKVKKLDIGIDFTLFRNWTFTFDYFYDKRYDIFMNREAWPQSLAYHIAKPWSNIGKMDNKGVEFSINYANNFSRDLSVSLQANFTYNKNKMVYVDEPEYPTIWKSETGKPYSRITGYIAEGLFKSQEEIDNSPAQNLGSTPKVGDIKYRDLNGDGIIDSDDQTMISKYGSTPRLQYGFGGTVNYKKFDFGVFFSGSALRSIMTNGIDPFQEGIAVGNRNVLKYIADNYWSEEKQNWDAKYPRLGLLATDVANNTVNSSYWLRNGSFLRLKNVEVGYKIPYGRIFVSAANLFTFSPFDLWDPELSSWNSYPMQKTVNVGIQLQF